MKLNKNIQYFLLTLILLTVIISISSVSATSVSNITTNDNSMFSSNDNSSLITTDNTINNKNTTTKQDTNQNVNTSKTDYSKITNITTNSNSVQSNLKTDANNQNSILNTTNTSSGNSQEIKTTQKTAYTNNIIYVSPTGNGNGETINTPTNIQNAIKNIAVSGTWTILLSNGTYSFTSQLEIKCNNLTITGSATNVPIFNGNGKSRMFYMANTNNIVNRILYLNNIKFINGQGSDLGGAIYINYGSLEVTNCKFINNYAGSAGGAITFYAHNSTSTSSNYLRIKDSEFTNNTAKNYAGAVRMYCIDENKMSGSNAYFINCLFQNNIAKGINSNGPRGGALNFHNIKGIITDCQFINNAAGEAGGAIRTDSTLTITNTLFDGNKIYGTNGGSKADYAGSAIYNNNGLGVGAEKAIITLIDCIFQNHDSNFKGTIYNSPNAYITIYNGIFRNNTAKSGGLIYSEGTMDLHGCKIYNNTAEYGGAIYNTGDISVFDNQIIDNKATNGAVIYNINACNLTDSKILNNYVTFNNGSVIYNTGSMNIVNNYFENNTDNTRDMLIGSTKSIGVRGNIYVGNYLEDSMTKVNDTSLSVKDVSFKYYETLQLKSIYNDTIRNGAITVYINGQAYKSFNVKDGSTNIEIPVTELDSTNTVLYSYASTDKSYQVTSTSFKITVYKIETKLNTVINNDTVDSNSISVTVKGIDNVLVPDGMVSIYEGFNLVGSATITNGVATFKLNLAAGKHTLTVNYTKGTRYANSHGDLTITIIKIPTYLNTVVTSSTVDNSSIQVKVIDIYGRNITSGTIIVYENNNTIGTGTVSNGISNIKLDIIAGEHNLDIKYFETNVYLSSNGTIPITVSKIGTITTATIVKESIEESSILVNVIDTNNKLVPDGTVNVYEGTNLVGQGTIVSGSVTIKLNIGIGSHKLNVRYLTNDKYLQSSYDITVTPGKISTNIFTTITNDKIKNSTIKVTVKDINNNLIPNGTVNVYEGTNLVGQGTVTSGVTNIKLNLTAGIHTITVRYEGTDTYGVATGTMNMTIYKISTGTTATITSNIPYNSGIKVIIIDQYGNNVPTGLINVTENGVFIASGTVNNGVSNIALNLLTGKHTLNIKYMENDIYLVSSTGLDLTVNKIDTSLSTTITNDFVSTSSIKVTVKDINNKTITSGVINVFENNNYIGSATITGTESNILLNLTAGTHTITVRYEGDNTYNKAEGSLPITVYKIGTKLASNIISNIVDNSSIKVTVTDTQNNLVTEGIVNIYKGTTIIGQGTIINGVTIISLNLTAGTHTINIKYMGTEKYLTSSFQTNITINKIDVNLNTVITHDTVGNSTIRVTVTDAYNNKVTNGTIIVYENGKQVGKATLTQTSYVDIDLNLTSGTHNLNINYGGTNKYNKNTVNLTLNLNKKDTGLTTSITNNIVGNSSIKVTVTEISNKKAVTSGTVIVYENNIQIGIGTVSSNGIANIKLSLTNGTHTITINYNGTSIYSKTTGSLNITIYKINTMITSVITNNIIDTSAIQVNITDIYGQKVKSGTVEIYEGTVLVGQASVSTGTVNIPLDLTVGKHTIKICYTGTNIYATSSSTGTVTINKIDTSLNTIITDDSIDNPTIRVTVIDANNDKINVGNVLVYEKGILIGVQKVVDSSAYVKLNILSGIHNITVVYEGTNKYATSNGTTTITINKLNTQLSKELTNNQVGNSTIKVTVIDNNKELVTNGTVSIYENNKLIGQGVISGGIVNIPLDLTAGNHNIKINYEGTTRYNVCNLTSTITINKVNTQLNTIITHDVVGNSSIQVHVTDSNNNSVINGIVNVYEGTTLIGQSNIENGICDINLKLTGGNHTIKVKYEGTTKYIGSEGTLTINLNKKDTTMSTVILNNTVDNSIIKVTVKDINNNLVPDGTVFIYEGTTLIGFNTITNGVTNIKLNILSGTHNITVNYNGTNTYSKTTGTTSITINKIDTTVLTTVVSNIIDNSIINVTVKDTYNNLVPNGAVLVYEGSTQIGTGIISNGITYIKLNLVSGTHLITVKYNGTTEYKPSNGTASITINKIDTSIDTIVTSNLIGNSSIKVTVKDTYNNLVPNGAVLVYESSKLIGQANISSGISNINLNLNTGSHTIKVTYNGTSKYNTSSRTTNIIVNKLNTQLNTIITHDTVGNSSIQVHVTDSNNNSVVNGLVLVYEGTTIIGQSNIENGVCDINLRLTSGSHTIKVKYEGTTKYIGSEGTLTINLNKIDTTLKTQIISSTVENTNIKVTVTDYNNNLVPSGVIFVYKGTTQIGTGIISNGVTNIKLNITSGTHDITVNYNGTSTYSKTSGKTSITVNKLSTSIDTSVTSSIIGNSSIRVTLKDENGNLVTGGMVTVYEKSNIIGTGTINNGISDINLNLNIGTHNITIKYGGSEIYNTIEGTTIITITNIPINKLNTNLNTELTNNVVSTSTIQVEIIDINGNPVTEGIVKVYEGLILIGQGSVSNGVSHILMDISSGTHTITVNYEGTEKYIGSSGNLDITIIKLDTIINTLIEHNTLNNTIIQVQVTDINSKLVSSGTVEVYENNTIVGSATISNGITNIKLNLGLGNHNITVNYTGTDKYGPSSGELSLKVTNTGIKSGVVNNTINNQIIQVNITDNNNNPINSGIIKIYENNNLISTVNVVNGVTNIKLNLTSGYHDLLINYDGNGKYNNATTNLQLTITIPTNINWLLTKNLQFNSNIEINITDINNHFVKEGKVQLLISGNNTKNIKVKNVTNGIVDIDLNDLLYGNYTIDIEYIGTTIYDSSTTSGSIYIYPSILMTTEVVQDTLGNSSIQVYLIYNGTQMVPYGNVNVYKLTSSIGAGSVNNGITGVISLNLTSPGIHKIKVTYPRTIYGSVEGVLNFNVNRISTGINTEILSNTVGNVTIKVTVKDVYYNKTGLNGTIKVFEGNTYRGSGTLVNGSAIIKIPGLTATNHTLKIEYSGNTEYLNSTGELNLTVEKISTGLTTSVLNSTIGSSRIQVIVNDLYNNKKVSVGNILVLENGKVIATGNITKGVSKINLDLTAGKHTLEIRYLGTGSYEQSNGTVNITIAKISTGITTVITNSSIRSSAIKVTVIDANKKLVPTGNVIVSESGKVITIGTISNGIVNIKLENLTARTHKLDILYNGTSTYAQSGGSINLTVTKLGTTLTTTIINDTIDGATIQIRITDMYGKNVTSGIVAVFENNKLLNQQKVTNGIITVALNNKLASGKHTINILYNETNVYLKSTGSINLTVYKLNTITSYIILHDTVKNNSLEIDVFDIYGRPVTNGILSITENGKIIAKTTITNGIYEIKLNLTKGTHYLNINYAGSDKYIASNNYLALNVTTKVETQISTTILNNTVNNATLKITVNGNSKPVTSGTITIYESGKIIGKGTLTNGTTTIKLNQKISGKHIITISYSGTMNIYSKTSSRIQINLEKLNTITKVNPIIGTSGSTVTFQANITDVLGKIVTEGRAIFKINGNTLKYSDGSTIYVNVKDGKAQLKYTLPSSWTKGTVTIQSVYGGSDTYNSSRSEKAAVKVNLRNATITIQQTITAKVGYNVTIQAIIKDTNTNQLLTGKVVFKINGITIKDANGTPIKVTVVNGKATLNYTIPTDFTGKKYKLTTIFDNPNYKLAKTNSILSIQKMTTHIQLNPTIVATTGKITTITGKILNEFNQTVPGTNKYVFKIDGKTLKDQKGNPIYYKATNGIINANITIPTEYKTGYHNLTIVTGERGGYTEARLTQQIYINSTTTQKTVIKV